MNRKRIISVLVVVLLFNLCTPLITHARIPDVPTDHWAYSAVKGSLEKHYLNLTADGLFKGSEPVDRFTLAVVIERLLEEIQVAGLKGTTTDLGLMRELSVEFQDDLGKWYVNEKAMREELQAMRENALSSEERVGRVISAQVDLEDRLEDLNIQVLKLSGDLDQLQLGFAGDLSDSEMRLADLQNALVILENELSEQEELIQGQSRDIQSLENWAGEKSAVFAALQLGNEALSQDIRALKEQKEELEKRLEGDVLSLATNLRSLTREMQTMGKDLEATQGELVTLREDRSYLEEIKKQFSTDVGAQMNAALIREQRLERQIREIEEEFADYRANAEKDVKSAKTLATVGIAIGAIGAIIGFITLGN